MSTTSKNNHKHESAYHHTSGAAQYIDDQQASLVIVVLISKVARATELELNTTQAESSEGVHAVITAKDIPGDRFVGPIIHDEPLLADGEILYHGQALALVVAQTYEQAHAACAQIDVAYVQQHAVLSIQDALDAQSFHNQPHRIARGVAMESLPAATVISGVCKSPAQDHFYLETQAALAIPQEGGCYEILSSTQHPTEVQKMAARVLGISANRVVCSVPRMGGGFGGKESQATQIGAFAALGAWMTGCSVKCWLDRDTDMKLTGKRHPFQSFYSAHFDDEHHLIGLDVQIYSNGGWTSDLSIPVMDRALFHLDNAYHIPNLQFIGRVCKTNLPSNTAFRGFGGPQGILVVEEAINRYSERKGVDPAMVRQANYYRDDQNRTPYGQEVPQPRVHRIHDELCAQAAYHTRRADIEAWNANSRFSKRGIGYQCVKFGISFTKALLNQAGALVQIYTDGSVQLNHSGTEMGQGLHTKMMAVCAHTLGISMERVRVMHTSTEKVPNTSPTAASSGSDLNGQAVRIACATLIDRLRPLASRLLGVHLDEVLFSNDRVQSKKDPNIHIPFEQLCTQAWVDQISLSATGYYRTPGIAYDEEKGRGTPFFYFAYGAAITEIELSTLTGEYRIMRTDILHDVGDSISADIDKGQIEGAYVQGVGWLSGEELLYNKDGRLLTYAPSTYKIPAAGDVPLEFHVELLSKARQDGVIHGSKAVGEPPFILGISVLTALRHAISSIGNKEVELRVPATTESVLRAVYAQKQEIHPDTSLIRY